MDPKPIFEYHAVGDPMVSREYEMKYEDDPNPQNKPDDDSGSTGNESPKRKNNGYISVIILAVVFIVMVTLLVYFLIYRSSNPRYTFNSNDIRYSVKSDPNSSEYDQKEDGTPDFSKIQPGEYSLHSDSNPDGKIYDAGSFATLMLEPSSSGITLRAQKSNVTGRDYLLSGTFNVVSGNVQHAYTYSFTISDYEYESYVLPLVRNVTVTENGKTVAYYNSSHFLSDIQTTNDVASWLIPLLLNLLVIGLVIYFANRMYRSISSAQGFGNPAGISENVARKATNSKVRFSDVAGCDEAKAELVEMVDYFHNTDKYTRLGAKLPHGVLLVGPPGTGKTLLAKAVAGEADVPFYSISGSDFVEMYVGVGASRVRSLFKTAKSNAPCLIFIDEIDAVGRQRGAGLGGGNDEREQTLNQLLVEMDGFEDNAGIIVMAATNRSDILDPALTRPGRFDRTITVDLPDRKGRMAILKVHSRNKRIAPDVNFDAIAGRTVGFSGADLANIMNDAAILAVRANRDAITTADVDEAIDRAIAGPAKKTHLEENEKKQVAYHEAGHAVIGIFLPYSDVVQKITIVPRGRTGGHVLMTPAQDHFLLTKNQLMARITGYLGGRTSEEIFFGDVSTGASNDIEVATELARSMVTEYGMSDLGPIQYEKAGGSVFLGRDYNSTQAKYSTQIAFEIDKAVRQIINECHEKATQLLTEHKDDVELIANTLIQNETITADQIQYLLKNRHLPPEEDHKLTRRPDPKNPKGIFLYPGYDEFYYKVDQILEQNPSRIVIVAAVPHGVPVDDANFRQACTSGAKDPAHIGLLFLSPDQIYRISLSVETFASHIEDYAGVPVLLIKTDDNTVERLQGNPAAK